MRGSSSWVATQICLSGAWTRTSSVATRVEPPSITVVGASHEARAPDTCNARNQCARVGAHTWGTRSRHTVGAHTRQVNVIGAGGRQDLNSSGCTYFRLDSSFDMLFHCLSALPKCAPRVHARSAWPDCAPCTCPECMSRAERVPRARHSGTFCVWDIEEYKIYLDPGAFLAYRILRCSGPGSPDAAAR